MNWYEQSETNPNKLFCDSRNRNVKLNKTSYLINKPTIPYKYHRNSNVKVKMGKSHGYGIVLGYNPSSHEYMVQLERNRYYEILPKHNIIYKKEEDIKLYE